MASQVRQKTWQQSSYAPYQFNRIAEFGTWKSTEDPITHVNLPVFNHIAKLHYARRKRTIVESYQAVNTKFEDTFMIVIRHNHKLSSIDEPLVVKIDEKLYDVISYSPDDDDYNSYDLLTLKRSDKVGGGSK